MGFAPKTLIEFINEAMFPRTETLAEWSFSNTTRDQFVELAAVCTAAKSMGYSTDRYTAGRRDGLRVFHSNTERRARTEEIVSGDDWAWRRGKEEEKSGKFSTLVFLATEEKPFHLCVTRTRVGALLKLDIDSVQASGKVRSFGEFQREMRGSASRSGLESWYSEGSGCIVVHMPWPEPRAAHLRDFLEKVASLTSELGSDLPVVPPDPGVDSFRC